MWIVIPISLYLFYYAPDVKCSMWDQLLQNLELAVITINQGSLPTEGLLLQIRHR